MDIFFKMKTAAPSPEPEPVATSDFLTQSPRFVSSDFPIKQGNWWRYESDNLMSGIDTMLMTINSYVVNGADTIYTCILEYSNTRTDTLMITVSASSLKFKSLNEPVCRIFGEGYFRSPFKVGTKWHYMTELDKYTTISYATRLIRGKNYTSFFVKRLWTEPGYNRYVISTIFALGVGIVEENIYIGGSCPTWVTYRLIDYHVQNGKK